MRYPYLRRAAVASLVLVLGCLTAGCGEGSRSETASKAQSDYAQSLKAQFQKRAAMQKGAPGKRPGH